MHGHHTPGAAINFLYLRMCWICSLSISWCISWIRINIISWYHLFYLSLSGSDFIYLCLTNIILLLFFLLFRFMYVYTCRCIRLYVRFTVFGKHCECIAQKCTHLERLPPLASHLLLLSHCVLTQHGGPKKLG